MRVVFVAWRDLAHPNAGGSEIVVDRLATGLLARGHEAALVCGGPVAERPYPVVDSGGTYSQYLTAPRAARRFRDWDLLVDVANGMPFFSPLWWRGPRLGLVHHVHAEQWDHYFPVPVAKVGKLVERRLMPMAYRGTDIIAISDSTAAALRQIGVAPQRIHLMHSGIDASLLEPAAPTSDEPLFLAVGRLAPNKGFDRMLETWEHVRPHTGGTLVIAGDGPERDRLAAMAGPGVELAGRVSEERKRELLGAAWLFVHTAHREGWGLVIMEAAAAGTPALALDVAGVRDAIVDGVTGVLAPDTGGFAEEWIALAADHDRRQRLGEHARRRATEFTWEHTIDAFVKAAEAALDAPGHARSATSSGSRSAPAAPNAPTTPNARTAPTATAIARTSEPPRGLRRSVRLFSLFRREPVEPDAFYEFLAADTVTQLRRFGFGTHAARGGPGEPPTAPLAVDIGGGPGYTADALRSAGARCIVVEYDFDELHLHGRTPDRAVQGDGQRLPVADGAADVVHSSNVLEHVPDPCAMLAEMVRVLRPGDGLGYVSFTNWYSPWGGHETSPWHYLGGRRAVARYRRRNGRAPKNEVGVSLFPLHISTVMRWFAARPDVEVVWAGPRYLPDALRWIVHVPVLRELVTWNLAVVFRRKRPG